MKKEIEVNENMLEGRNAVTEALKAGRTIDKVFLASGDTDSTLRYIASLAKKNGAVVTYCDRRKLDTMTQTGAHQGVIAMAAAHDYATIDEILAAAQEKGEAPLVVICDEITDPHNLGAIIRTAECAGAHGVIIPKRRSSGLTAVVGKASAGAMEYMKIARVSNLAAAIQTLKDHGVWVYGTAADGAAPLYQTDLTGPAAIVIGSEGEGMGRLVKESCDFMVSIPMKGHINSLNASNACAILLYEAVRQRIN
ncbi:MAG: 23S rRNA (guanosine(2251)-2'-O)-methyltransferase RlmB [Oscillospiraceae bacterium]|nr:23S rRNA (guanosine(2251)-2'-O)-methyltransferase RlmB [Oscillospiraceae bacterium]